ncbi:hypothetical protein M9458_037833, partial [Cirrhinus mrigala]
EAGITILLQASFRAFSAISCNSENVVEQNETVSLSAVDMSSTVAAEESGDLPSPFVNIPALVCDHSYLPTRLGSLVDNALVKSSQV